MNKHYLAVYLGLRDAEVDRLLHLKAPALYQDESYLKLVESLNYRLLENTLLDARSVYDEHLPELVDYLRNEYNYQGKPMTALTLGNWLLGFLHNHQNLHMLHKMHAHIPMEIIEHGLPKILEMLGYIRQGGKEWQRAMAVLSLPLLVED